MAAQHEKNRARLSDLPADFSLAFLDNSEILLKSRQQGFKYFSEGYLNDISMHIDGETIEISARSFRSQRKTEQPHTLHLQLNPTRISEAHCTCQAGVSGSCSHIFVNPKLVRKKRPVRNTLKDCRNIKVHKKDIDHLKSLEECSMAYVVSSPRLTLNTHLGTVPVASGLATSATFFELEDAKTVGTCCGNLALPQSAKVTPADLFKTWFTELHQEQCIKIEESTRDQANSTLWQTERKKKTSDSIKFWSNFAKKENY
ncbi:uncharacterized protein LOC133512400 [Syngnathoides biaculeatus]|uniref:uncharacterized protein LOC133512400 n=1 Tax=Syngnathoides biaculeatus TaxID=300417 RepID=UPI002ADE7E20|nr:uncharacterized protein LOC133512400 [Syngnathoides biaculeatus]